MTDKFWDSVRNPLAVRLRRGELGLILQVKQVQTPNIAMVASTCGYDAIYLDMQHTAISVAMAADMAVAALSNGVCPIVRIAGHNFADALRLLDAGAFAIVIPGVTTADQARAAVEYLRFAPIGKRSVAGTWPHFKYRPVPAGEAARVLNEQTLLTVMIEDREGMANVEAIAAVPGIDVLHMGTNDLAADLGLQGDLGHDDLQGMFRTLVSACRKHGKIAGVGGLSGSPQLAKTYIDLGARFITGANEWSLLVGAARERAAFLRGLQP
ncbi:MAG TPA: aldolase/citrate lyase family protein [Ramlibacter sp.]|nr:aldolase/citrate lyase family protein [Ramlibacter sp.]